MDNDVKTVEVKNSWTSASDFFVVLNMLGLISGSVFVVGVSLCIKKKAQHFIRVDLFLWWAFCAEGSSHRASHGVSVAAHLSHCASQTASSHATS